MQVSTEIMTKETYSSRFDRHLKLLDEKYASEGGPARTAKIDAVIKQLEEMYKSDDCVERRVHPPFKGRFGYGKLPKTITVIEKESVSKWQQWRINYVPPTIITAIEEERQWGREPTFYQETDYIIKEAGVGEIKVYCVD